MSLRSCNVSRCTYRLASDYSEIKIRLTFAPDAAASNYAADYNKPPTMPMLVAMRSVDGRRVPGADLEIDQLAASSDGTPEHSAIECH